MDQKPGIRETWTDLGKTVGKLLASMLVVWAGMWALVEIFLLIFDR